MKINFVQTFQCSDSKYSNAVVSISNSSMRKVNDYITSNYNLFVELINKALDRDIKWCSYVVYSDPSQPSDVLVNILTTEKEKLTDSKICFQELSF